MKSKLDEYIQHGVHGTPELKKEEKAIFLGEFKERVYSVITLDDVKSTEKREIFSKEIKAKAVDKIIVNEKVSDAIRLEYMIKAKEHDKDFKLIRSKSDLAVVLACKTAI